jgi:hypothetical protein
VRRPKPAANGSGDEVAATGSGSGGEQEETLALLAEKEAAIILEGAHPLQDHLVDLVFQRTK